MLEIFVDGDACPVKAEVERVAERHGLAVTIVSNGGLRPSRHPSVRHVTVGEGADAADDWIAEHAGAGDIVVTADIPLAVARAEERRAGPRTRRKTLHRGQHRHGARHARPSSPFARGDGLADL